MGLDMLVEEERNRLQENLRTGRVVKPKTRREIDGGGGKCKGWRSICARNH